MILLVTVIVFATAGAWYGWRKGTERVVRGSLSEPPRPSGVSREDHLRRLMRRRKAVRLGKTLLFAVLGALAALLTLMIIGGAARMLGG